MYSHVVFDLIVFNWTFHHVISVVSDVIIFDRAFQIMYEWEKSPAISFKLCHGKYQDLKSIVSYPKYPIYPTMMF